MRSRARTISVLTLGVVLALIAPRTEVLAQVTPPTGTEIVPPFLALLMAPYQEPLTQFGAGHRGVDLAANPWTPVAAGIPGTVTFAGPVAGELYITIEGSGPRRVTYSYMGSIGVSQGATVVAGQIIGESGTGHAGREESGLHLGLRVPDPEVSGNWLYRDPMPSMRSYLRRIRAPVVTLAR